LKPVGILRFLGTNCDADVVAALDYLSVPNQYVWWADHFDPKAYSGFVLPGGFSYGDYLRAGALAARAPAMDDLRKAAELGAPVLGICNGFQILCEAELLEGALTKNESRQFQDEWVELRQVGHESFWSSQKKKEFKLPIAHSLGRYFAPDDVIKKLLDNDQIWLKYRKNPNGSFQDIAGITNKNKNVAALMPHPERAMQDWMGSEDGCRLFECLLGARS
jgi:phosphoribosylformylglycinamidine synthase I